MISYRMLLDRVGGNRSGGGGLLCVRTQDTRIIVRCRICRLIACSVQDAQHRCRSGCLLIDSMSGCGTRVSMLMTERL